MCVYGDLVYVVVCYNNIGVGYFVFNWYRDVMDYF